MRNTLFSKDWSEFPKVKYHLKNFKNAACNKAKSSKGFSDIKEVRKVLKAKKNKENYIITKSI